MEKRQFIWATTLLMATMACNPHFISHRFTELTTEHQTIAVLPFEIRFTGLMPSQMLEQDIVLIEEAESRAFQYSFYNELLRRTRRAQRSLSVEVQDHGKTLALLAKHDITIRESWDMLPEDLAPLLGVDAVVRARIQKARIMSDLASLGIDIGRDLINRIARIPLRSWLNGFSANNKVVVADYAIFDKTNSTTLWSVEFQQEADWRRPAHEMIDQISRRAIRKFPYRP